MIYFVATPIGNMKDITLRALEVLRSVDLIACEDTRHSRVLLDAYDIHKPLVSYHKFNENESGRRLIEEAQAGKNVAVITDAGMPAVSDPGEILVRRAIEAGVPYTVIPGASACLSALVLGGLSTARFAFIGFLPEKKSQRRELLERYSAIDATLIFYSAPHDVEGDIKDLYAALGDRQAAAVREITKLHETAERFRLSEGMSQPPRGEYVLLVEGAKKQDDPMLALTAEEHVQALIDGGLAPNDALKQAAKARGVSKSQLYPVLVAIKKKQKEDEQ